MVPGAGGFYGCVYLLGFETFNKLFDFFCIAFELLFFNDVSCLIHGSCLDKVFMAIHSYIECTHNGISPPCSCVSWGINDRYLFVLRWHILTGRLRGRPIKETVSDFGTIETTGCPVALCQFHLGIDVGLEEVFSCH